MGNNSSTFSGCLRYVAEAYPYRPAISVRGGGEQAYADFHDSIDEAASCLLSHGIKPGDVVLVVFSDDVEPIVGLFAVMRVRGVAVPIHANEDLEPYICGWNAKFLVGRGSNPTVVFALDSPGYAAVPGDVSGVVNVPGDLALLLLLTPDGACHMKKTQGELAALLRSAKQLTASDPVDPLLLHLRGHRHLASVFLLLAASVRSLSSTTGAEVVLAEGGSRTNGQTPLPPTDYGLKLPELSLAFASPFLINLTVKYLSVQPWSETTAALLSYLAVLVSLTGLALHISLKRYGGWLGAAALALNMTAGAMMVVPAFDWGKGLVAFTATLISTGVATATLIRGLPWPWFQDAILSTAPEETRRPAAAEKLTPGSPRWLPAVRFWFQKKQRTDTELVP